MANRRRRSGKKKMMRALIVLLVVLAALIAALFLYPMFLPKIDPFEYVKLEFEGDTGSGAVSVVPRDDLVGADVSKITYRLSKDSGLVQGEKIRMTAESRFYNLLVKEKEYTVDGLNEYLMDVADLSENAIMSMHEKSETQIRLILGNPEDSLSVKNELISKEPCRIWLLASDAGNILYDVYQAKFRSMNGKEKTVYLVIYYENVRTNPLNRDAFAFDSSMFKGDVFLLGNEDDSVITGYSSLKKAKEILVDSEMEGKTFTSIKLI